MRLIDTHAHLDDEQFDDIRAEVVERMLASGVSQLITVGTTAAASQKCVDIAEKFPSVFAAVGVQPNYVNEVTDNEWLLIEELSKHPKVVAIGETGIDHYWNHAPLPRQEEYFLRHLELSQETGLPFVVHMRDPMTIDPGQPAPCAAHIHRILTSRTWLQPLQGVMHSYTGDASNASKFLALGLHISFAGMVTYKNAQPLRDVARSIPSNRLLVETDAPYLSPVPKRGQRPNEPSLVIHTAAHLATTRGEDLAEFARSTTENALRLFSRMTLSR